MVRCPEWGSTDVRGETAARALAAGDAGLHDLLVEHNSAKLRKPQLLHLCQLWRYRSHVWKPRGVTRKAGEEAAEVPAQVAVEPRGTRRRRPEQPAAVPDVPRSPSRQLVTGAALAPSMQLALASAVVPIVQRALPCVQGLEARHNAAFLHGTIDLVTRFRDTRVAAEMLDRMRLAVRARRQALRDWAGSLQAGQHGVVSLTPAPGAWLQLCGEDGVAEAMMRLLATAWGSALQDSKRNEAQTIHGRLDPVHPAVLRWFVETQQGILGQLEWLAAAQALLAPFKCGEVGSYIVASDAVMESMEYAISEAGAALTERQAWLEVHVRETASPDASEAPSMRSMPLATQAVYRLLDACGTEPA